MTANLVAAYAEALAPLLEREFGWALPGAGVHGWREHADRLAAALVASPATRTHEAAALEATADEVKRVREEGLRPGQLSAPYAEGIERWLRARAAATEGTTQ